MVHSRFSTTIPPVDYLAIGHVTRDITPDGVQTGGTVTYAALAARAMGLRAGILTAVPEAAVIPELDDIVVVNLDAVQMTTFENTRAAAGRVLHLRERAPTIEVNHIPEAWQGAPIVHLGPVAQEINPHVIRAFANAFIGVTPQGWMRSWDAGGRVQASEWPESAYVLQQADAAVISIEDVGADEARLEDLAASVRVLAVTEGARGCRVYWNGDLRRFSAPSAVELDSTGAGDIFAAAFFVRCYDTRNPWEAARYANQVAACSVGRAGLAGVPTPQEIRQHEIQIIQD